jgi:uncharacterized damage-inducible protein DinB/GNAT superfamily N-acetyltransferase
MADAERIQTARMVQIAPIDPSHPHAQHCLHAYFTELDRRFDTGFDPALSISADLDEMRPPAGLFLVATLRAEPIGSGALKFHGSEPAELKRMWVAASSRGLGVGRRILNELEVHAAKHGARAVHLETNKSLVEAIALYRSAGYVEVPAFNDEPYADHWFEKRLDHHSHNVSENESEVVNGLLELFRYKTWATLRLIEYCQRLDDEHLDATTPGSYGTIRETLHHLVDAEEGYLSIMTRERFISKAAGEAFVRAPGRLPEGPVSLDQLAERIRRMGPQWEAIAEDADLPGRDVTTTDGMRLPGAVVLAQTIQHAGDHRSHVMSILGSRDLELPGPNDLDAWGYAEALDLMQELPAT